MLTQETKNIQVQLADYCQLKEVEPIPGTVPKHLHHYRRLIYNIIDDALESAYPITRGLCTDVQWELLVDEFVVEHPCQHPQIFRMPYELIAFAEQKDYATQFNIPFLQDLLYFEWIEIEVHSMADVVPEESVLTGDFMQSNLVFNPYFKIIQLDYPIHLLKSQEINGLTGSYFLIVYREPNGTVQYTELNQFTAGVLLTMHQNNISAYAVLLMLEQQQPNINLQELIDPTLQFIHQLLDMQIIHGLKI
jgi:hypothetical protein